MKSVFRSAVFAILVALLAFVPVMSTHAQADMCFGLKAEDCTLLQGMGGADMSKLSSFVMDYTITAKVTGTGSNDVDFSVTGNGPFSIDATKMTGASSNPTAAIGGLTMANTITASLTASGQTQKGSFEFRILNGTLYFMGDMATQGKWMSVDLTQALGAIMSNPQFSGALNASSNPAAAAAMDPEVLQNLSKAFMAPGVITAKRAGKRIAGYGAPGKGNTLLNHCGIREDLLPYTVDRSPHKHGMYLPGTHIPIFAPERLAETRPDYIVILPWNLRAEIVHQLGYAREWGAKFVVPIPQLEVI